VFALGIAANSVYGQPYIGPSEYKVYGSGSNSGFGQQFVADRSMTVRRVSFLMRATGKPSAPCNLVIQDVTDGTTLDTEYFCSTSDFPRSSFTNPNFFWISRNLSAPLDLIPGHKYRIWLHQDGFKGDQDNCYRIRTSYGEWTNGSLNALTFGGTSSYAVFASSAGSAFTTWINVDTLFKLDSTTLDVTYRYLTDVTSTSATVVINTNIASNVAVEYGETSAYGRGVASFGQTRHEVKLDYVAAGQSYHYRVIAVDPNDSSNSMITQDSEFRIPRSDDKITLDVVGDMQQMAFYYPLGQAFERKSDMLISVGDTVEVLSVNGIPASLEDARLEWQQYLPLHNPGSKSPATYFTIGNHERTDFPGSLVPGRSRWLSLKMV
jgi:hypothetical protein